jgi:hypothetical protein
MVEVRWKVKEFLEQHGEKPYGLAREMGLEGRSQVIYRLVNSPPTRVDLKTLGRLLEGLGRLTHEEVVLSDILEVYVLPEAVPNRLGSFLEQNTAPTLDKRVNLAALCQIQPQAVDADFDPVQVIRQGRGHPQ